MRLAEFQAGLAAGLRGGGLAPAVVAAVVDGPIAAGRRLAVHQNHVRHSLGEALALHFPVIGRLVGAEAFSALCRRFIAERPPEDPRLALYGAGFAAFLETVPEVAAYPYLAGVARLEWARLEVARMAVLPPLTTQDLAAIPPQDLDALPLALTGARVLATAFAVDRLWEANQPGRDGRPDGAVDESRRLLLRRDGEGRLLCGVLTEAEFAFLATLAAPGGTLGGAAGAALAAQPAADLGMILGLAMGRRIVSRHSAA